MSLAILNDNKCYLLGLVDTTTGAAVNNALLSFTVTDKSGAVVASGISMSYQDGSNGSYIGILPASTALSVNNNPYTVVVSASNYGFSHTFQVNSEVG